MLIAAGVSSAIAWCNLHIGLVGLLQEADNVCPAATFGHEHDDFLVIIGSFDKGIKLR